MENRHPLSANCTPCKAGQACSLRLACRIHVYQQMSPKASTSDPYPFRAGLNPKTVGEDFSPIDTLCPVRAALSVVLGLIEACPAGRTVP